MYPIPSTEKLVETKACRHCQTSFPITDKDLEFYDKVSPTFGGKKYSIPTPTLCPECRNQRRLAWRSRRKLYKRKCDATGRDIIAMFSPDKPYKVYHTKIWEGDSWDPKDYGRGFDFSRSFFSQYDDLLKAVPLPHLAIVYSSLENADYANGANDVKNAYLSSNVVDVEDVYYSEDVYHSSGIVDGLGIKNSEECYGCVNSTDIHNGKYVYECSSCVNCFYCSYCSGCNNCIGCVNLVNQEYCIFNVQYTQRGYEERRRSLTWSMMSDGLKKIIAQSPVRNLKLIGSGGVIGNNIVNSSDCYNSFDVIDCSNIRHSVFVMGNSHDCQDISFWWQEISLCYEWSAIGINSSRVLFSAETYANVQGSLYCYFCYPNSSNLFGCVGLRNTEYCILNKQYTKEEYEILVPRIIEHMMKTWEWGEFFPSAISPFGYNETAAMEDQPLTKQQATKDNIFHWSDYEAPFPKVEKIIPAEKLPQDITQIPDDILNWAIECEVTKKPFRIIKQELEFYRKHNLPIPKRHPDQRHLDRMAQRNPRKLFERKCDCCHKDMITTYAPERPERVYCEECYNREVIW